MLLEETVGYVKIDLVRADAARAFYNASSKLLRLGARSLVIDLRGCPGGDLEAAYDLAADFLPRGSVLGRVVDADGDEREYVAERDRRYELPVVLWVDGQTRSAAEVFAGALQQHDRAVVIGERTFGKGTASPLFEDWLGHTSQVTVALPDGTPMASGIDALPV
jgi:carboxyl-terminal processing protease